MPRDEIRRQYLVRDLSRRLQTASIDELLGLDRVLSKYESIREGVGDRRWERHLPTGPRDFDRSFHLAAGRPSRGIVETLCNGSWPFADLAESQVNPAFEERCRPCWLAAVAGDWLGFQLVVLADQLDDEERRRAHEPLRAAMVDTADARAAIGEYRERESARLGATPEAPPRRTLTAAARARLDAVVDRYRPRCTGLTARWCPLCGDCSCGDGEAVELNDPACPLHAPTSQHGEPPTSAAAPAEIDTGPIAAAAEFVEDQHATRIGGSDPYESIEIELGGEA